MVYGGLTPPVLFAHGEPEEVGGLLGEIPTGTYQVTLLGDSSAPWAAVTDVPVEKAMWRMVLPLADYPSRRP